MKIMTCKQLGGACDQEFKANTFEEMKDLSHKHGIIIFQEDDEKHIEAMNKMKASMSDREAMNKWMEGRKKEFDALPECE